MSADRPLSKWILYFLWSLFILVLCLSGYWMYAPVSHWSSCGLSSSHTSFTQVEPAQATLHVAVFDKKTNKKWIQYWTVHDTSQDCSLKLHAGVATSKRLFGLEIPSQRREFITHIQTGLDTHGSTKSYTYDMKWYGGNK